jgi:hypothetical protein
VRELESRLEELAILTGALASLGRAEVSALEAIAEASELFEQAGVLVPVARAPRAPLAPLASGTPEPALAQPPEHAHPVELG